MDCVSNWDWECVQAGFGARLWLPVSSHRLLGVTVRQGRHRCGGRKQRQRVGAFGMARVGCKAVHKPAHPQKRLLALFRKQSKRRLTEDLLGNARRMVTYYWGKPHGSPFTDPRLLGNSTFRHFSALKSHFLKRLLILDCPRINRVV